MSDHCVALERDNFTYDTFQSRCIRLVRLVSYTDNTVECEMKQLDLTSPDPWFALSYVWGTSPPDHTLLLNKKSFEIRANLFAALKAIDNAPVGDPSLPPNLWIWIDAICINQDDNEEKSKQVPLMGEIYSQAREVFVWLGDHHVSLVSDILTYIDGNLRLTRIEKEPDRCFWLERVGAVLSRLVTMHIVPKRDVKALYSLHEDLVQRESFYTFDKLEEDCVSWLRTHNPKSDLFNPQHAFWDGLTSLINTEWYQRVWT